MASLGNDRTMRGMAGGSFRRSSRRRSNGSYSNNGYNANGHNNNQPSRRLECRLKPVAAILAVVMIITCSTMAVMFFKYDMMVLGFYRREFLDGGPGTPWVPPDERPIPLEAFPDFARVGYNIRGKLNVKRAANVSALAENEPPVTLLFMHLWKCAGSSLRHMLRDWARLEGQSIGIVVRCTDTINEVGGAGTR